MGHKQNINVCTNVQKHEWNCTNLKMKQLLKHKKKILLIGS